MCFGGSKSTPPPPPPPPPAAPPVLEQEAPELSVEEGVETKDLNKARRGTQKYKNDKNKGDSGTGLGSIKKIVK